MGGTHLGDVRVGCGALPSRTLGLCYRSEVSADGVPEVTITLLHDTAPVRLLATLTHELIHAAGVFNHYRDFQSAGRKMGLVPVPRWTSTDFPDPAPSWAVNGRGSGAVPGRADGAATTEKAAGAHDQGDVSELFGGVARCRDVGGTGNPLPDGGMPWAGGGELVTTVRRAGKPARGEMSR